MCVLVLDGCWYGNAGPKIAEKGVYQDLPLQRPAVGNHGKFGVQEEAPQQVPVRAVDAVPVGVFYGVVFEDVARTCKKSDRRVVPINTTTLCPLKCTPTANGR